MMKRERAALLGLLWLALALRLLALGSQSLWYDEGVTWYLTRFSLPDLVRWTAADIQPPLYYLLEWGAVRLWGASEFGLRLVSAGAGVLAVPLMWHLGRRLFRPWPAAGLWAAAAATFAPVMVYYGQEARMYTVLALEAIGGSLLLWQLIRHPSRKLALQYALVMAAALYTHYFAAFLLAAHAIFWLLEIRDWSLGKISANQSPTTNRQFPITLFALTYAAIAALFAPWMPVLLARLGDDPSYWPGALKLPEVVQDVFISFAVGGKREMILEAHGLPLAMGFGLLLLAAIIGLARTGETRRKPLLFLLLWLVVPVAGVLLLSYRTPKFNPRYTLLAWPAFGLMLAALPAMAHRRLARWSAGAAVIFVAASWVFALHNWFAVPQFSKDDFKHVAQFIRERYTPGDTVLLSSGHLFPVWQYYFGDENWTPLPRMETLDVNRVTGFDMAPSLQTALAGHSGAWLVTWQDEVIDPNGVVPLLLDYAATRQEDDFHRGDFWGVGLHYWQIPPGVQFPADFPADVRTDVNFGNLVRLRGLFQPDDGQVALFWQAKQSLEQDYLVSVAVVDAHGIAWSDGPAVNRPADYRYPAQRWPVDAVVVGRQAVPWLTGAPPGEYWLEVGWLAAGGGGVDVLDAAGNPQSRTARLGPIRRTTVAPAPPIDGPAIATVNGTALLTATLTPASVETGAPALLDALWRVETPAPGAAIALTAWQDAAGTRFPIEPPLTIPADYAAGTIFRARLKLPTPVQAIAGPASLLARPAGGDSGPETAIAAATLRPTERVFAPPTGLDSSVQADFGGVARLLGTVNLPPSPAAGESAQVTLVWQSLAPLPVDYTVFAHLLGPQGTPVQIADHLPPRPTSAWVEGEIVADTFTLTVPPDLPPGRYPLEVGLYDAASPTYARLPVNGGPDTHIILTEIEVTTP